VATRTHCARIATLLRWQNISLCALRISCPSYNSGLNKNLRSAHAVYLGVLALAVRRRLLTCRVKRSLREIYRVADINPPSCINRKLYCTPRRCGNIVTSEGGFHCPIGQWKPSTQQQRHIRETLNLCVWL
jgi:hypothetical protein